jgi:hypothetical protein
MKTLLVGAAVFAAMVAATSTAHAQSSTSPVTFGFSGGLTIPFGSLGDINGAGLNLQAHAGIKPSSIPFGLRGDLGLFTTAGKTLPNVGNVAGNSYPSTTWTTANVNAVYNFEGAKDATFVPYVLGGVGLYNGTRGFGSKFGVNGGGGLTFKLSGFDAFAEARVHNIFTDGFSARMIPISFGINFKP